MSKGTPSTNTKANEMPFEKALARLEEIVESMESEDLPLETLLARYEEGSKLGKVCHSKLADAELKIQQLEKNSAGELSVKSFDSEDSSDSPND